MITVTSGAFRRLLNGSPFDHRTRSNRLSRHLSAGLVGGWKWSEISLLPEPLCMALVQSTFWKRESASTQREDADHDRELAKRIRPSALEGHSIALGSKLGKLDGIEELTVFRFEIAARHPTGDTASPSDMYRYLELDGLLQQLR